MKKQYRSLLHQTNVILENADPIRLMSDDTPGDEYTLEAEKILARVYFLRDLDRTKEIVSDVFFDSCDVRLPSICLEEISIKLLGVLENLDESKALS